MKLLYKIHSFPRVYFRCLMSSYTMWIIKQMCTHRYNIPILTLSNAFSFIPPPPLGAGP